MAVVWLGVFLMDPPQALGSLSFAQPQPETRLIGITDTSERARVFRHLVEDLN
ncbi:hypothetical protein D3C86_1471360 [compost metagenome]